VRKRESAIIAVSGSRLAPISAMRGAGGRGQSQSSGPAAAGNTYEACLADAGHLFPSSRSRAAARVVQRRGGGDATRAGARARVPMFLLSSACFFLGNFHTQLRCKATEGDDTSMV